MTNLTTSACWRSAYSSEESPLQQHRKRNYEVLDANCGTNKSLKFDSFFSYIHMRILLYISPQKIRLSYKKYSAYLQSPSVIWQQPSPAQTASSPLSHHCFLCSTGELCLRAALITFTICYSYMQKAIFLRDPLVFEGRRLPLRLGGWSVYVFNIFWVALLGNRLGVAWPWVYRNNGRQLIGT